MGIEPPWIVMPFTENSNHGDLLRFAASAGGRYEGSKRFPKVAPRSLLPITSAISTLRSSPRSAPRPVRFVAKTELFAIPVLRRFLRWIGTIPVERSRPDVRAVRESLRVLERGELLGIFPEGTRYRHGGLGAFHEGVGWFAIKARAPVIPIAIYGYVPWKKGSTWMRPGRLKILCGEPLFFPAERYPSGKKPYRAEATREVYLAIQALLDAAKERIPGAARDDPLQSSVPGTHGR